MAAVAAQTARKPAPAAAKADHRRSTATVVPLSTAPSLIQRACACGGRCPSCDREATVQAKLTVSQPGDPLEREAEHVAARVMRMPDGDAGKADQTEELDEEESMPPVVLRQAAEAPQLMRRAAEPTEDQAPLEDRLGRLRGGGQPLPGDARNIFEQRMGHDFGAVRVHAGPAGNQASQALHAHAFTLGSDVAFAPGQYAPATHAGRTLLAHELAHVVQQGHAPRVESRGLAPQSMSSVAPAVQRKEVDADQESLQFLQSGWQEINELGIVYKPGPVSENGGVKLRRYPMGPEIRWLPQNTKLFILRHHPAQQQYAVTTVDGGGGEFGYAAETHVWRYLPDPEADVLRLKPGDTPFRVAGEHYAKQGFDVWGKDKRYIINALVWVNNKVKHNTPYEPGIAKPGTLSDPWFTAETTAGVYIWLPGKDYLNAIYEAVVKHGGGTGSISADLWQTIKGALEYAAYGLAFVGGLLHGFFKSLYDAVAGLVSMVGGVLKSIFTGQVLKDAKQLWQAVSKLTWKDIKEALGTWGEKWEKKLNSSSPWVAGHAHGYLTGYIMAEAAQLLISGGTLAAAKAALWASRFGKAVKGTRAFMALEKGIEKTGTAGGKVKQALGDAAQAVRASRPFKALGEARDWARHMLQLSTQTLGDLTLEAINRLRLLSDGVLDKLRRLSPELRRIALGCASPCKVNLDAVKRFVGEISTTTAAGAQKLTKIDDVIKALPAGLNTTQIAAKLKKHKSLMQAIIKSDITDADLAVITKFLTPADATNPATAYRTFVRTLTALAPTKVGGDIRKFNELAEALIDAGPRMGAALKGPMFESFVKLNIHPFRAWKFSRAEFSRGMYKQLHKTRQSDAFIDSSRTLWEFKHTVGKVPADQAADYLTIMANGLKSIDGMSVKSVNYLFPTKEVAELNADLMKKGFGVYYVSAPNVRSKL